MDPTIITAKNDTLLRAWAAELTGGDIDKAEAVFRFVKGSDGDREKVAAITGNVNAAA